MATEPRSKPNLTARATSRALRELKANHETEYRIIYTRVKAEVYADYYKQQVANNNQPS